MEIDQAEITERLHYIYLSDEEEESVRIVNFHKRRSTLPTIREASQESEEDEHRVKRTRPAATTTLPDH